MGVAKDFYNWKCQTEPTKAERPPDWADAQTLEIVRPLVRDILNSAPAFQQLSNEDRLAIYQKMVEVATYMANPDGLLRDTPSNPDLAKALAGRGDLVKEVDFPKFVSGLIQGVFEVIVESSIEQMEAYGELLGNVAKTVKEFTEDNITEKNARDWLAERFPDKLEIETLQARLAARGNPSETAAFLREQLKIQEEIAEITDVESELKIVTAARMQMARTRQQMLATMVLMGINRIVVAGGRL